ncbi:MAG: 1-acyl-sn-glycerol-3-phosphate acyltransferase [Bacteroidales bacterium]|nr:1-acyl-sn-glycerol-3-phosphate acyltransferase [Bacteroidales bacterium]
MVNTRKFIDLDEVLKKNSPKAYKFLPGFLINKLKKIVHEEDINHIMTIYHDDIGQDFVKSLLNHWKIKVNYCGLNEIPANQKYVIASNHPLGGLDGIAMLNLIYKYLGNAKAIVNDLLLNITNLKPVLTGVNVFGKFSKKQILDIDELYQGENQILVFPSGLVSRKIKGEIKDMDWKKSFLVKAIENGRSIIPVYAEAKNSNFFYNLAKLRKFLGFKFNIELIYLPDEMFKFAGQEILFKFGKPIPVETFTTDKDINYWVEYIRAKSDELKNQHFDDVYELVPTSKSNIV